MIKSVTVEVMFPCTEEEWKRILTIRSLAGSLQLAEAPKVQGLSDNEEKVLRAANGTDSDTPLLDIMAKQGMGSVNKTKLIMDYVTAYPGCSIKECITALIAEYNLDLYHLTNLIHTLCHSKKNGQRKLDKIDGNLYLYVEDKIPIGQEVSPLA